MGLFKLLIFASVQIVLTVVFTTLTLAQTITVEVSGNGENSQNSVDVGIIQETTVQSTNEAQLNNNVNADANSGQNSANNNVGDAQITTGDITQKVDVENEVNKNVINLEGCGGCANNLEIKNSENGANSVNSVNTAITNETNILAINSATITNNLSGSAVSGKNIANNNVGNVKIETGDVTVKVTGGIINQVNSTFISIDPATGGNISILNLGNGVNSVNGIDVEIFNSVNIEKVDFLVIENNILWDILTGGNSCSGNVGNCEISTGDIDLSFSVVNSGNVDVVFVGVPKLPPIGEPEPAIPPQPGVQPPAVPGPAQAGPPGPSGPAAPGPGEVLAALAQLPVTGPANFVFLLLFWLSLLLTGVVLKRLGNHSPPVTFSIFG